MDASSGDLETKYHKIAAEYAKLRAQASVLKKAVVEEQSRNIALHDVLREREQNVRKSSQEIDSLTFRNQQLTKRVTVLQNELDATENRSKKGKSKMQDSHSCVDCTLTMNVLDEELQKKIVENAELVSRMHDEDTAHRQEVAALHAHADKLKHELEQYYEVKNASEKQFKSIIDKLEIEKAATNDKSSAFLNQEQLNLQTDLQSGSNIILTRLPFVVTNEDLNKSEATCDEPKLPVINIISQTGDYLPKLIAALTDYYTLIEERLNHLQSTLSPVNLMFSSHLKENSTYLEGMQVGFNELQRAGMESRDDMFHSGLQGLSDKLTAYTSYLLKLLPYHLLSLDEENVAVPKEELLVSSNMELAFQVNCMTNCFVKLSTCVKLLSSQSALLSLQSTASQCRYIPILIDALAALSESIKDLLSAFAVKICKEQEIPTYSGKIKAINDSIVNSLSSMGLTTKEMCNILSHSHLKTWKSSGEIYYRGNESSSIPSRDVILEQSQVQHTVDGDTLAEQLALTRKTAVLLEQEKEHWHLECQLLQLKHSKRMEELEQQLMLSQTSSDIPNKGDQQSKDLLAGPRNITNLLGHLEAPLVLSAEVEAREQEVKNYLKNRIDHLVAACQGAETKAITFRAECAVLRKRLDLSMSSKIQSECRLSDGLKQVVKLQEELHTTTHNYETQLSIMSEHLANMNDKLTVQRDEIDQLKYQLSNKASQKRKQK